MVLSLKRFVGCIIPRKTLENHLPNQGWGWGRNKGTVKLNAAVFCSRVSEGQTHSELFRKKILVEYHVRVRNVSQGMNSHSIDEYSISPVKF